MTPATACECGCSDNKVVETRRVPISGVTRGQRIPATCKATGAVRRRRECCACGQRWTTYEVRADAVSSLEETSRVLGVLRAALKAVEP